MQLRVSLDLDGHRSDRFLADIIRLTPLTQAPRPCRALVDLPGKRAF